MPDIPITLNGEPATTAARSLRDLVAEITGRAIADDGRPADGSRLGVAAALDDAVVPRGRWAATPLHPQARVEIVTANQGG
ncbi:sulfur carrier protein ThiS [Pseudoclavibacter caeni]|jgi:sulfur carrier protein|uniref:Sulfur carrier protein ThiS n=1 Tax=Pseudoclavibacter caeni TaxID=908846 RepID=A0A7C8FJZ8_9MICO|nr:sulfur carrier protein ThiS [Pseudoclavibacter caeni]KAB1631715.1 sulfur carrier protein ThiS [Pseudoclavibacter caeni]NYJ97344.1 sulfur carrier protein [Pseudoclavibacter caeni]